MSDSRFVIVAQPRTGSTFLHLQLLSHPQVVAYGEILHPVEEERRRFLEQADLPMITHADDPVQFLKKQVFRDYPGVKAVGFKLFYKHARNDEWQQVRDYLRDSRIKVIHLKRRNLLDRYLSFELAMKSDVWINLKEKKGISYEPVSLDPKECFKDFHKTKWFEQEADDFFKSNPKLEVIYEELAANPLRESGRLLDFLGLDRQQLTSKTKKQRTQRKSELIANYHNLKEILQRGVTHKKDWAKEEWLEFFDD